MHVSSLYGFFTGVENLPNARKRCEVLVQDLQAPGGGEPGPRHRGQKTGKAVNLPTINDNMRAPGMNEMQPTGVNTIRDEKTPTTVRTKDLLRQAPIPPAITARLWGTSQKMLTRGRTHLDHVSLVIQLFEPVNATSNPATPAATIRKHARASIFRNPNLGIAIP